MTFFLVAVLKAEVNYELFRLSRLVKNSSSKSINEEIVRRRSKKKREKHSVKTLCKSRLHAFKPLKDLPLVLLGPLALIVIGLFNDDGEYPST